MTNKERAIAAFQLRETDRTPTCIFLGGSWPIADAGANYAQLLNDPVRSGDITAGAVEEFDADIVTAGTGSTALFVKALGGSVEFGKGGFPIIRGEPVVSEKDLSRLSARAVAEDHDVHSLVLAAKQMAGRFGGQRLLLGNARGPFTLAGQIFGLEQFSRALYKNPSFAHELLTFATEMVQGFFDAMLEEGGADGIVIADPTASGDVVSRRHFETFAFPYLKQVVSSVKARGKPVMLHICGNIGDRLEKIAELGIDCLSVDIKMDICAVKQAVGTRMCIAGNVDPVQILKFGGPEQVRQDALRCIHSGGPRGFVLMPGCDLAVGVPRPNIAALRDAAHETARPQNNHAQQYTDMRTGE